MKKLLLILCAFTLTACGGHGDKKSDGGTTPVNSEQPQVNVPANALLTDYSCDRFEEVSENGGPIHPNTWNYKGVKRSWREADLNVYFEENADGLYKSLSRQRIEAFTTGEQRSTEYATEWTKNDRGWQKQQSTIESLYTVDQSGVKKYFYRRVDGRDTPPVWETQIAGNGPKSIIYYKRHLNPSMLNGNGRVYSRVTENCIYTDR